MSDFKVFKLLLILYIFLSIGAESVFATPDYAREKRWADEIVPGLLVGDPVYLQQKQGHEFLGILSEPDNAKVAIIVVHGMGLNPDWDVIGFIRRRLYDLGDATVSIQMPVLAADAKASEYPALFPDAMERISVSVDYLKKRGYSVVALVSHSNGSRMSRVYMQNHHSDITAWAALSLTRGETFAGIPVPVLDIYGEFDLPHVLSSVSMRKHSLEQQPLSSQVMLKASGHFYNGHEEELVELIRRFFQSVIASRK